MSSNHVVALLMAAGYSRRFGPFDKRCALLSNGQMLLAASVANAQKAFTHLRVAVREEDEPALLGLRGAGARSPGAPWPGGKPG